MLQPFNQCTWVSASLNGSMHINANMIEGQLPQNLDEFQYQVGLWAKAPKQSSSESHSLQYLVIVFKSDSKNDKMGQAIGANATGNSPKMTYNPRYSWKNKHAVTWRKQDTE